MIEVPLARSPLNNSAIFLLNAGERTYTWFRRSVSSFERSKSAQVAHNLWEWRLGGSSLKK